MQSQIREIYDQDCSSSTSSMVASEDEAAFSHAGKTSNKSPERKDGCASKSKDLDSTLDPDDFQIMVQNYKQIGGEIDCNLKLLETKWHSLNKTLLHTTQECELLSQQKVFQMKNLVDLQIKLETFDSERVSLINDWHRARTQMTEEFTYELQSILENDDCIRTTYNKFQEILNSEKHDFVNFLGHSKSVVDHHRHAGENYESQVYEVKDTLQNTIASLLEEESSLREEINQDFLSCRAIYEQVSNLKASIKEAEHNMMELKETHNELKLSLEQKNNFYLIEVESNYNKLESDYKGKINEINARIETEEKICSRLIEDIEIRNKNLSENKLCLESIKNDCDYMNQEFSKAENAYLTIEKELFSIEEDYKMISLHMEDAETEEANLKSAASKLPSLLENLTELNHERNEAEEILNSLRVDIAAHEETFSSAKITEESLMKKKREVMQNLEEIISQLPTSEKILQEICDTTFSHCTYAGIQLEKAISDLNKLKSEVECNREKENDLADALRKAEADSDVSKITLETLQVSISELNEETVQLAAIKEEIEKSTNDYNALLNAEVILEAELKKINEDLEKEIPIGDLENELTLVNSRINEATLRNTEQINTIEMSYLSQHKNWEDKASREIKDIEKGIAKNEIRTKKLSGAEPRLNHETSILEKHLSKSLPSLANRIERGLHTMEEMAKFYYKSFNETKKKGAKANLVRYLTAIEEQLSRPVKCMMSMEGIPRVNLDAPSPDHYKIVLKAFKEKYNDVLKLSEGSLPLETAIKEIGHCMFGKKWVKPTHIIALNDTEISSSTNEASFM